MFFFMPLHLLVSNILTSPPRLLHYSTVLLLRPPPRRPSSGEYRHPFPVSSESVIHYRIDRSSALLFNKTTLTLDNDFVLATDYSTVLGP